MAPRTAVAHKPPRIELASMWQCGPVRSVDFRDKE